MNNEQLTKQLESALNSARPKNKPSKSNDNSNMTISGSGNTVIINTGDGSVHQPPILPAINEMSKKDRKAFDEGVWDGIEKRSHKNPKKEELAAKRKHQRRLKDRQDHILHYTLLFLLGFCLFGSLAVGILTDL